MKGSTNRTVKMQRVMGPGGGKEASNINLHVEKGGTKHSLGVLPCSTHHSRQRGKKIGGKGRSKLGSSVGLGIGLTIYWNFEKSTMGRPIKEGLPETLRKGRNKRGDQSKKTRLWT